MLNWLSIINGLLLLGPEKERRFSKILIIELLARKASFHRRNEEKTADETLSIMI